MRTRTAATWLLVLLIWAAAYLTLTSTHEHLITLAIAAGALTTWAAPKIYRRLNP